MLPVWIVHADATRRVFDITAKRFQALAGNLRGDAVANVQQSMEGRYAAIFQRRHDCIHNCDRPRMSPQPLDTGGIVLKVIQDVEFLVNRCNEHINTEFRTFLVGVGCSVATIIQAGY